MEWDVRKLGAGFRSEPSRRLPGDQETAQDRILRLAVPQEPLVRLSSNVALDGLHGLEDIEQVRSRYAACLGGIDFKGGSKNRPPPDRVLILLDRTAREQIHLAPEDIFNLLVKFKEVPPEMHLGLKGYKEVDVTAPVWFPARERSEYFQSGNAMMPAEGREPGSDLV